jgi:hypothetical protein
LKEPLDAELKRLYDEIQELKEKQTEIKLKEDMTLGEKIQWLLFENGYDSDMKRYYEADKFFKDMGLWVSGYYPHSQQKALEIMLYKGAQDNLDKILEGIKTVLPFIKPMNAKGERRFELFEHTLSEWGIYDLRINKYDVWILNKTTYGREEVEKVFDNLYEALKYCQEHHYYESSEDE